MIYLINSIKIFSITLILLLNSCGSGFLNPDWSKTAEPSGKKRARQNVKEGKGVIFDFGSKGGDGNFLFASSNPLWRASLDTIDFMSLSTVDYSGGVIITDWYSENNSDEAVKITIKFLSNEIRSDALQIDIHKRVCKSSSNCLVNKIETDLNFKIQDKILKKAAIYNKDLVKIRRKNRPEKKYPGDNE